MNSNQLNITKINNSSVNYIAENIYKTHNNNVRDMRKQERIELERNFNTRRNIIDKHNIDFNNDYSDSSKLIPKLRRVLSKKFDLSLNDYIIIIDKFKLNSNSLSRSSIEELLVYLKSQTKYNKSDVTQDDDKDIFKSTTISDYALNKEDFDSNLKQMETERSNYINNFLMNNNSKTKTVSTLNNKPENTMMNHKLDNTVNTKSDTVTNHKLDNIVNTNSDIKVLENKNDSIPEISKILLSRPVNNNKSPPIGINDIFENNDDFLDINSNINSDNIKLQISDISENIQNDIENKKINKSLDCKIIEEVLMFNLLKDEKNGKFIIKINYNNKNVMENVVKIQLIGFFINKDFCEKNNINKSPSIIIRIDEFNNSFYINGSNISGFCQCLLEKNNNYYTYTHTDTFYGIYKPLDIFSLTKLTINLLNINGDPINNFIYDNNDVANIMFKITRKIN